MKALSQAGIIPHICLQPLGVLDQRRNTEITQPSANLLTLSWVSGYLVEAELPLAGRMCLERGHRLGHVAGRLYGLNLTGAWAGAIGAGIPLVPSLGVFQTTYAGASAQMPRTGYPQEGHFPPFTSLVRTAKWTRWINFLWHCGQ